MQFPVYNAASESSVRLSTLPTPGKSFGNFWMGYFSLQTISFTGFFKSIFLHAWHLLLTIDEQDFCIRKYCTYRIVMPRSCWFYEKPHPSQLTLNPHNIWNSPANSICHQYVLGQHCASSKHKHTIGHDRIHCDHPTLERPKQHRYSQQ